MEQPTTSTITMSRRERRRQETIDEILDLSLEVMKQDGVGGLSLTAVAKKLGVQPTALYKYFPSLVAVYDALFRRAVDSFVETVTVAMNDAPPGMASIREALQAVSHWAASNPEFAQLLTWKPVSHWKPPRDALANAARVMDTVTEALTDAAAAGEITSEIANRRGAQICSVLLTGAISMHFANSGGLLAVDDAIELVPDLVDMFVAAYSPDRSAGK